jgi:hypothetical protein
MTSTVHQFVRKKYRAENGSSDLAQGGIGLYLRIEIGTSQQAPQEWRGRVGQYAATIPMPLAGKIALITGSARMSSCITMPLPRTLMPKRRRG